MTLIIFRTEARKLQAQSLIDIQAILWQSLSLEQDSRQNRIRFESAKKTKFSQ